MRSGRAGHAGSSAASSGCRPAAAGWSGWRWRAWGQPAWSRPASDRPGRGESAFSRGPAVAHPLPEARHPFHGGETGETAEAGQLGLLVIDHLAQLVDPGLEGVDLSLAVLEHDLRVLGPRRWRAPRAAHRPRPPNHLP